MRAMPSKDPLTASTTSILLPSLKPFGFRRLTGRVVARISSDILQSVSLQLAAYGGGDLCVNYASLTLFNPRDFFSLSPGDRLRRLNAADAWFPSSTHEAADASMREVVPLLEAQALPFFQSMYTPEVILKYLKREKSGPNHHRGFDIACCLEKLERFKDAERHAQVAANLYRKDGRPWALDCARQADELLASLRDGSVADLLA